MAAAANDNAVGIPFKAGNPAAFHCIVNGEDREISFASILRDCCTEQELADGKPSQASVRLLAKLKKTIDAELTDSLKRQPTAEESDKAMNDFKVALIIDALSSPEREKYLTMRKDKALVPVPLAA